jgi:type IV secretory pathway component VirB8
MATLGGSAPYYAKDGALRAYANRVVILAAVLTVAVVVLGAIVLVTRAKPPVVIQVSADGKATVISPEGVSGVDTKLITDKRPSLKPDETAKKRLVIDFVNAYWGYDEHTISEHWSISLNMMTPGLRKDLYGKMAADGTVGNIEASHEKSEVKISSIDSDQTNDLVYHVLSTRIVTSQTSDKAFTGTKTAESYTINLVETDRTIQNPSGLLISGFKRDVNLTEPYLMDQQ